MLKKIKTLNYSDSRFWENTYIDAKDTKGKAFVKVYPGFVE